MGIVLPFPARRRRRPVATPLFPAEVRPFPPARVEWRVADLVRRALRSQTDGRDIIDQAVAYERIRLNGLGIDASDVERAVAALSNVIQGRLWRACARRPGGDAA